jgi:hypothetical protein
MKPPTVTLPNGTVISASDEWASRRLRDAAYEADQRGDTKTANKLNRKADEFDRWMARRP